jgi:hypothetical protein
MWKPVILALLAACPSSSGSKLQARGADPAAVSLLYPGAHPWGVVRYSLAKGAKVAIELALDMSLTSGGQGGAMPTMVFDLDLTIEDVAPDGSYTFRSTIAGVSARDRDGTKYPASALAGKLDAMNGVSIVGTLRADGTMVNPRMDLGGKSVPDALAAQLSSLTQSLERIATPLPTAPIGVGAIWKTTRDVDQSGLKVATSSTVMVSALDHRTLTFDVASEMHGADQQIQQKNVTIAVSHIAGVGSGHAVVDLSRLAMTGDFASAFHADMSADGQSEPVDMQLTIGISSK